MLSDNWRSFCASWYGECGLASADAVVFDRDSICGADSSGDDAGAAGGGALKLAPLSKRGMPVEKRRKKMFASQFLVISRPRFDFRGTDCIADDSCISITLHNTSPLHPPMRARQVPM